MSSFNYLNIYFHINNQPISTERPSLMAKYDNRTYKIGSSRVGSNINFKLISDYKIYVKSILLSYV